MPNNRTIDSLSRRGFLQVAGAYFLLNQIGNDILAEVPPNAALAESAGRGRQFLESMFDPSLDLLPEYREAQVYWLFHDNYLAAKVLANTNPEMSKKIQTAIGRFGVDHSGKIEILFGEAKQPLPFRRYELVDVRKIGQKMIRTEVVKETPFYGWQDYADLLFLAAIAEPDQENARQHLNDGLKLWDGTGFHDQVAAKHHQYTTYKLALSLIAASKLDVKPEPRAAIIERLLAQQSKDGGWITDYDETCKPIGLANVETTCMAILGLEAVAKAR